MEENTQKIEVGKVVLEEDRTQPVVDVAIKFKDRPYCFSDTEGKFEFVVTENQYLIEAIQKDGYQLVSPLLPYSVKGDDPLVIVLRSIETPNQRMISEKADQLYQQALLFDRLRKTEFVLNCLDERAALDTNNIRWQYDVGLYLQSCGDYRSAMRCFNLVIKKAEELYGTKNQWMAKCYESYGDNYMRWNAWKESGFGDSKLHFADAKTYYTQAGHFWYTLLGENNVHVAQIYRKLGECWNELDNTHNALQCFEKALGIYKPLLGENDPDVASVYADMVNVHFNMGNYDETKQLLQKWLDVKRNLYVESSELYQKSLKVAEDLMLRMKK